MPNEPRAAEILERWRALDRELAQLDPESMQAAIVRLEARQLREEYRQLVEDGLAEDESSDLPMN